MGEGAGHDDPWREAREACEQGAFSRCLRLLEGAPESDEALALAVRALEAQQRWDELQALLAGRDGACWALPRARALAALGRASEALVALGDPLSPEALRLDGELRLALGLPDLGALLQGRAEQHGEVSPELWRQAGLAWLAEAEQAPSTAQQELASKAISALQRHRAAQGASVTTSVALARALRLASERGRGLLEGVADEGQRQVEWHMAYLRALLDEGDLDAARRAAEQARQHFPKNDALTALAGQIHRESWAQMRLKAAAGLPLVAALDGEPSTAGAPDFLLDLRARIRSGALAPTRPMPAAQREVIEVLCRYDRANAFVTGPPGCGKSALLRALSCQLAAREEIPPMLRPYALFELDPIAIVGGTDNVGVLEGRLTALTRFCETSKAVLFIDNAHLILGAGSYTGRPAGLSELLQPLMSSGHVKIVAACSDESYDALARSVGLERRVTRVRLPAMKPDEASGLLGWMRPRLEEHYGLGIPEPLLPMASRLASDQIRQRALPDSAVDLVERAGAKALVEGAPELNEGHLLSALAQLLLVPVDQVRLDRMERLLHLESLLSERVVGQGDAIRTVSDVVRVCKADLSLNSSRPDGVFLFVGPSGVGKTELARALADTLHTDESAFVRLDMSEFSEPHNVSRLFGTTPGYVGFEQEGQLTSALRLNPGAVVLLDEIEKAHPKVYDVFLQVFDAGRLTDGRGKAVDCSRATFILTSNLGTSELIEGSVGFLRGREGRADRTRVVRSVLERHFRPEFLNRFDAIVVFDALSDETLRAVIAQKLGLLRRRFAERGIELSLDEEPLLAQIAARTDRHRSGARGVLQTIERLIVVPLARHVLARQHQRSFRVTLEGDAVKIEP